MRRSPKKPSLRRRLQIKFQNFKSRRRYRKEYRQGVIKDTFTNPQAAYAAVSDAYPVTTLLIKIGGGAYLSYKVPATIFKATTAFGEGVDEVASNVLHGAVRKYDRHQIRRARLQGRLAPKPLKEQASNSQWDHFLNNQGK